MAIDPLRLVEQQRIVLTGKEVYKCPSCGRRTRNRAGKCTPCIQTGGGLDLTKYSVEQLVGIIARAKEEMSRRAAELKQAIEAAG